MTHKRILLVSNLSGTNESLRNILVNMGHDIEVISECSGDIDFYGAKPPLINRILNKLGIPKDIHQINSKIIQSFAAKNHDILWIEKSLVVTAQTLEFIKKHYPNTVIIWNSFDDMFVRHNQSYYFRKSIPIYDLIITTKSYNCDPQELPSLGAKQVIYLPNSTDLSLYRPKDLSIEERQAWGADVSFAGTFERNRAEKLLLLANNGIKVRIWGNGWNAWLNKHPNLHIENLAIYKDDYLKCLCASKINLCFLRKINRDLQTCRSIEIPACGAFMLAERTTEHLQLFEENKEAVYFDINNSQELLKKVRHYLDHDDERTKIAAAGRKRCEESDYSHEHKLRTILSHADNILLQNSTTLE